MAADNCYIFLFSWQDISKRNSFTKSNSLLWFLRRIMFINTNCPKSTARYRDSFIFYNRQCIKLYLKWSLIFSGVKSFNIYFGTKILIKAKDPILTNISIFQKIYIFCTIASCFKTTFSFLSYIISVFPCRGTNMICLA